MGLQHSVLLHRVEDAENVQEEVDNVQVEVNGGQDVLLRRELLHQHAGVIDDEATEDQGPSSSQEQTCIVTVEEELQREQSTRGFKVTPIGLLLKPNHHCSASTSNCYLIPSSLMF